MEVKDGIVGVLDWSGILQYIGGASRLGDLIVNNHMGNREWGLHWQ
jgi:hypothetical protein